MAKANNMLVRNLEQAIVAYGSERKLRRSFGLKARDWQHWQAHGVPRGHHLGLLLGLEARGYRVSPRLFGARSWAEFPGT
jgi:hypothetical protein